MDLYSVWLLALAGILVAESKITYEPKETRLSEINEVFYDVKYLDSKNILTAVSGELREYIESSGYKSKNVIYQSSPNDIIASVLKLDNNKYIISKFDQNCLTLINGNSSTDIGRCSKEKEDAKDGSFSECRFNGPFGLFKKTADKIIVADEFNDALRLIDLKTKQVSTLQQFAPDLRPKFYAQAVDGTEYVGGHGLQYRTASSGVWKDLTTQFSFASKNSYLTDFAILRDGVVSVTDIINEKIWIIETGKTTQVYELCGKTASAACKFPEVFSLAMKDQTTLLVGRFGEVEELKLDGLFVKVQKKNLCYGVSVSSEQTITYKGSTMKVWCDITTPDGPWITVLNRCDGSQDFNKPMAEYEAGFGSLSAEHWLGLKNLHTLTSEKNAEMRINLESFERMMKTRTTKSHAHYKQFWIGDKSTQYTLEEISGYSGTAGDMETLGRYNTGGPHKDHKFSTLDADNDGRVTSNCADLYGGGWWFNSCYTACLTCGPYQGYEEKGNSFSIVYTTATRGIYNLKAASMMIKLPPEYEYVVPSS